MKKILVINGPNINLLGSREKDVYGATTYADLCERLSTEAQKLDMKLEIYQSNHEGELVDKIQSARGTQDLIVINPGAYTHTSIAIRDALIAVKVPFIEVHISNVFAREEFRRHSYISDVAAGVMAGFGVEGYFIAVRAAAGVLSRTQGGN
ncbi:MAG: type II 3-dehydroquinate dehydratase [Nitrospinae bacterium]|nr:type II 3-dehydroquinate dehydratase [Nitrospinota bacterium]